MMVTQSFQVKGSSQEEPVQVKELGLMSFATWLLSEQDIQYYQCYNYES